MKTFRAIILMLAITPLCAFGQFDTGESPPAWQSFKLNPKIRMKLDFRNANADLVISLFQKTSGITIVKDPALTGGLTITSAAPVSLNDAFQILNTVLGLKSFELKKEGNLLVIRQKAKGGGAPAGLDIAALTGGGGSGGGREQSQLKVYPIKYANSSEVARVINEVFAPEATQANNPFRGGGGFGGGGRFRFGGGNFQLPQAADPNAANRGPTIRASSDDFSNSVIVNAPSKQQRDVEDLIKKIDRQTEQPQQSRVFKLLYAVADDLAPVVQNVLVSNAPTGRGGQGQQNVNFQQRFQQALRFGSAQASFGQVAADSRTNSLIVTATDENLKIVESVIKELDKDIPIQNTTFVFPLANARADQVAALITQALGSRSGTNSQANVARAPSTANRNTQNQNRNQNRPTNFMGGLGGEAAPPADQAVAQQQQQALELALQDPNADAGRLLTSVGVAQGGFFQQILGGQQRPGQTNQQNRGRDEQGRVVSVRDLVGQVTVIPDPNTNSVIVVGSPDSASLVRSILDQLDKIPEQVMIETIVVEATLDTANKLGIEWSLAQPRAFGTQGAVGNASQDFGLQSASPAPTGFKYTLNSGNLTAFLNAIRTDQRFEVLSTPRIFTSNNVQAEINISQSVPYVLSQRLDTNGNLTFNYAFQDVGIVLTVTPRITANGYVTMDVSQTANDLQGFTSFNAPIVNQRQADTTVSVKDGETVILGGIIRSTVSSTVRKIPLLGDIPILGNLFKTTEHDKQKTELMVFLSPHIVRNADEAKRLRERNQGELNPNNQRFVNENLDKDKPSLGPPEKNPQEKPPGDPKP